MEKTTSATDHMNFYDEKLDEYEKKLGLPDLTTLNSEELKQYFELSRDQLEKLMPEDCDNIIFILKRHAFDIQRAVNRDQARINWSNSVIAKTLASVQLEYKGFKYEERMAQAIKDNDYTKELNEIKIWAQQRIDRLSFLSNRISDLAETLKSIGYNKRKHS